MQTLFQSKLSSLSLRYQGKVRDVYDIDDQHILIVATDRLSAFDVVLPTPVPGKGQVLTALSNFWFQRFYFIPNHLQGATVTLAQAVPNKQERAPLEGRTVVARKLKALPAEAVVRGYLIGSGWRDYQRTGELCGIKLPQGLQMAEQLPEPIFTPSTKAELGDHDENISFAQLSDKIGSDIAEQMRTISVRLYREAASYALERGIIIADTKFEFGLDEQNNLVLIDELLTPDSSRFWPLERYQLGTSPPSFDKQFIRDYLETLDWDKTAPGPELPARVLQRTTAIYQQAQSLLIADA